MSPQDAKRASPVDVAVGLLVRRRRGSLGMSQVALARQLGVTFQQVQKYESGKNRIGASRLHAIAQALGVPVSFFFGDADAPAVSGEIVEVGTLTPEGVRLNRAFLKIGNPRVRRQVVDLVQSIADSGSGDDTASTRVRRADRTKPN